MNKAIKVFEGSNIRTVRGGDKLLLVAFDIAKALNVDEYRKIVVEEVIDNKNFHTCVINFTGKQLFTVDANFALKMALRVNTDISKRFIFWLLHIMLDIDKTSIKNDQDDFNSNEGEQVYAITQIASEFGMSAYKMNTLLYLQGIQRKVNKQWVLYSYFNNKGYVKTIEVEIGGKKHLHTYWTEKGRKFIHNLLRGSGINPILCEGAEYKQLSLF